MRTNIDEQNTTAALAAAQAAGRVVELTAAEIEEYGIADEDAVTLADALAAAGDGEEVGHG